MLHIVNGHKYKEFNLLCLSFMLHTGMCYGSKEKARQDWKMLSF